MKCAAGCASAGRARAIIGNARPFARNTVSREQPMGLSAYQRARSFAEAPRSMEHRLLGQVTGALIAAERDGMRGAALMDVSHWNREIWATFSATCADAANRLPPPLRASIISLALWVDRHSSEVIAGRAALGDLIDVNRLIMDGLAAE
jgi:flagellar protein FlaF